MAGHQFYYTLSDGSLRIFISRAELAALHKKIGKVLARRGRGHRSYYISASHKGRCYSRLKIAIIRINTGLNEWSRRADLNR